MKRIFLLGGYDLEMKTVGDMLEESGEVYFDKSLKWDNAVLSAYQDVLDEYKNQEVIIYGIELRSTPEEFSKYSNYNLIDHHNELSANPAALTQVAQLLNKSLNRYRQLVAANDSDYIPGMERLGATREEIEMIRREDRKAQGVTEEDERQAEYSIRNHKTQYDGLIVVETETSRFSAICDRLYPFRRLLIYNDSEWMYYGEEAGKVIDHLSQQLSSDSYFYGGGSNGFVGVPKFLFPKAEVERMVMEITRKLLNKT